MKIATYNIQNLFHRHIDLIYRKRKVKQEQWNDEFESLLNKLHRKNRDYRRMRELADLMGLQHPSSKTNKVRHIDSSHPELSYLTPGANPTDQFYLKVRSNMNVVSISQKAVKNKIKVISDANPDILLLQEVENRSSLIEFNTLVFKEKEEIGYKEIIHLDGNGSTGLGMGILLKEGYRVKAIRSFSSERDIDGSFLFTNDLQSYKIETPTGQFIYVLCVQLISNSMEGSNEDKRTRQAEMVSRVYAELRSKGNDLIVVLGTLNASKFSKSISPIMETDMINISELSNFEVELDTGLDSGYFRMGAYRKGVNIEQNNYLLASPTMKFKILSSGMNRKAVWPLKRPKWVTYESIQNESDAASEHPLLWVNIEMEKSISFRKLSA